jgi:glutamine cyclotransferase
MHLALALLLSTCIACSAKSDNGTESVEPTPQEQPEAPAEIPIYSYQIVNTYPHDPNAFTQGLVYLDGALYEGTGPSNGRSGPGSSIRKVDLETGTVLQSHQLTEVVFGEGIAVFLNRLIQLTWKSQLGFTYDLDSFDRLTQFTYPTEGWGLTCNGEQLIMSDGTANLYFRDPFTFAETGRVEVTAQGRPIRNLNELEWVEGEVFANIWTTQTIARIDPATGQVKGWIDATDILSDEDRQGLRVDVFNGIAYDSAKKRLFVTGKWWPKLYQIELTSE